MAADHKVTAWLIYRARDESLRTVKSAPNLDWDEIAWRVNLSVPAPWGNKQRGEVNITLPEMPPSEIVIQTIERPA